MLDEQFRMHPRISEFPNKAFYQGQIRDGLTADEREGPDLECFPVKDEANKTIPLAFYDVTTDEEQEGKSFRNWGEVETVKQVANLLKANGIQEERIGIISPYGAQVRALRYALPRPQYPKLKIASVDSFQGGEKDYIIMSCVRSGGPTIGFLGDMRRLNVSLTRARYGLVMVGNTGTLSQYSRVWNQLAEHFRGLGVVHDTVPPFRGLTVDKRKGPSLVITKKIAGEGFDGIQCSTMPERHLVRSPISGARVRIVWPEDYRDMHFLRNRTEKLIQDLDNNKNVVLVFDTESVQNEVICLQIGRIFNPDFDVFASIPEGQAVPSIERERGMIVFCVTRDGIRRTGGIAKVLGPLFAHPRIVIATFDFTSDILNLERIGIKPNLDRIIDAQLLRSSVESDILTWTDNRSLAMTIEQMQIKDPILDWAKQKIETVKYFPWNENEAAIHLRKLPVTSVVTKHFLKYAVSDIALTGLALAEVLAHGKIEEVHRKTQIKADEYRRAQTSFGLDGPRLVRQAAFMRLDVPMWLSGTLLTSTNTDHILKCWRGLLDLVVIQEASNQGQLLRLEKTSDELKELIGEYEGLLRGSHHWPAVVLRCQLSGPPEAISM
jgi:hypothetical protein